MTAQRVEDRDRRLGIGHAHVHVQPGDGRGDRVAEETVDALVAFLVRDPGLVLGGGRVGARAEQADPGLKDSGTPVRELADGVPRTRAYVADELDHPGMQFAFDAVHGRLEPRGDGS